MRVQQRQEPSVREAEASALDLFLAIKQGLRKSLYGTPFPHGSRGSFRNLNGSEFLHLSEVRRVQWTILCQSCCSFGGHVIIAFPSGQREQKQLAHALGLGRSRKWLARLTVGGSGKTSLYTGMQAAGVRQAEMGHAQDATIAWLRCSKKVLQQR